MNENSSVTSDVLATGGGFLLLAVLLALGVIGITIASASHRHYSLTRPDGRHLPLWGAVLVGIVEVCIDKPAALHHSRMAAVRRYEARLAEERTESMLRHPSNYRARRDAMAHHPSNFGKVIALHGGNAAS